MSAGEVLGLLVGLPNAMEHWALFLGGFHPFSFSLRRAQAFSVILRYRMGQPACTSQNSRGFHLDFHTT